MKIVARILLAAIYVAIIAGCYRFIFSKKARELRTSSATKEREADLRRAIEIQLEVIGERVPRVESISGIHSVRLEDHIAAQDGVEAFLIAVPEGLT
jgi:hypothetical protein